MRATSIALLAGLISAGVGSGAWAQGSTDANPVANGGNGIVNNGQGSGTGTASPGPGMTLKEGSNPTPTASPVANGGNTDVNSGGGSGTGTKEPKGDK